MQRRVGDSLLGATTHVGVQPQPNPGQVSRPRPHPHPVLVAVPSQNPPSQQVTNLPGLKLLLTVSCSRLRGLRGWCGWCGWRGLRCVCGWRGLRNCVHLVALLLIATTTTTTTHYCLLTTTTTTCCMAGQDRDACNGQYTHLPALHWSMQRRVVVRRLTRCHGFPHSVRTGGETCPASRHRT